MTNKVDHSPVSSIRIILFGSEGGYSRPVLEQLLNQNLTVAGLIIVEPLLHHSFPVGVKQPASAGTLEAFASKNKVALLKTHNLSDTTFHKQLNDLQGDIMLLACFGHTIPACIWQNMKPPCWNLHPSLLPAYRGPDPLYWQLKKREIETGLTLHEVSGEIDAGDILGWKKLAIPENHERESLDAWVAVNGVALFYKTLLQYLRQELKPKPQVEALASYYPAPARVISST